MGRHISKRKCKHCQAFFHPARRNLRRQRSCSRLPCRQARKAASQRRWLRKPDNRDYFRGPAHIERVRQGRQNHPGYWRRQASEATEVLDALQDDLAPQETQKQPVDEGLTPHALQHPFFMQPAVLGGLIAPLTGLSLQEDIAMTARRLPQLGRDILHGFPDDKGGQQDAQTTHLSRHTPHSAPAVQLGRATPGP